MDPRRGVDPSEDELDAGLAAGFAASVPARVGESVLASIERVCGAAAPVPEGPAPRDAGRHRIAGEPGRGGVGVVCAGTDLDLGREVALGVLRPDRATNQELARRFIDEARVESGLEHPEVVPVYDLGAARTHRPFFAMELARGRPLSALLLGLPAPERPPSESMGAGRPSRRPG